MKVWLAVMAELWEFVLKSLFGYEFISSRNQSPESLLLPSPSPQKLLTTKLVSNESEEKDSTSQAISSMGHYFVCQPTAKLRLSPAATFDNVFKVFSFAKKVNVTKQEGRWVLVVVDDMSGWMLKDDLSPQSSIVTPQFSSGVIYDSEHNETLKTRLFISDQFNCLDLSLPLISAEYVYFRLIKDRYNFTWPQTRPRHPGQWQNILRGHQGVHMGIKPLTKAVMEYVIEDVGNLYFVDAVFPDNSIQISGISTEDPGQFVEKVLKREEWLELRPIFIDFR